LQLSSERVLRALEGLGLERVDAEVYVYLANKGPQKGSDVAGALKIRKQQLHSILKNLQTKGVVTASSESPALFSAVLFEKALEVLVEANMEQAKAIRESKEELLYSWRIMAERDYT
jgi:sugar-specific transcriptional regulator TrmB